MKNKMIVGLIVLVGLSACTPAATTNNVVTAPPANTPAPLAINTVGLPTTNILAGNSTAAAPALTTAFLTGVWAEGGCETPNVRLNADGTTEGGRWRLQGNTIIRTTPRGEDPPLTVAAVAPDRISVSFDDLPAIEMTRCPG